jgi:hypothetical protein
MSGVTQETNREHQSPQQALVLRFEIKIPRISSRGELNNIMYRVNTKTLFDFKQL